MNMFRVFMELEEAYNSRQMMIDDIKKAGKHYNFDKYSDAQLYRMWQRLQKPNTPAIKEPEHELDLEFSQDYSEYCDCGAMLSDAGFCPVCDDGEEDLTEYLFDGKPLNRSAFVSAAGKHINTATGVIQSSGQQHTQSNQQVDEYVVRIVSHGGRLRALSTDGVHPAAWVAFPKDLRQFDGQAYKVDKLIWNGKNYRVAGNITEV